MTSDTDFCLFPVFLSFYPNPQVAGRSVQKYGKPNRQYTCKYTYIDYTFCPPSCKLLDTLLQPVGNMAARYGLGVARAWAYTTPIARATPKPIVSQVRSFGARPQLWHQPLAVQSSPIITSLIFQPCLKGLRIRHNSSSAKPPTEPEKESAASIPSQKPIDPLTAPPIAAAADKPSVPATTKTSADPASILKLLSLAKPQWPLLTVGISCLVISTGVNLGIPWAIGRIIDYFAPGSEATLLFGLPLEQATWALVGVLLVGALANSGRAMALRLAGQRTVAYIR
jgi:hypothetical protein